MERPTELPTRAATGEVAETDPWRDNEAARLRRLREDGKRSLGRNLSEGLAHSEFLSSFTGVLKR